mmetsp:Transcript_13203/g.16908  ORF Transcript_13203/g.16908 Transcript_13203/m.16908 type:complete len:98 (+) Transcript_13203:216-509(+)
MRQKVKFLYSSIPVKAEMTVEKISCKRINFLSALQNMTAYIQKITVSEIYTSSSGLLLAKAGSAAKNLLEKGAENILGIQKLNYTCTHISESLDEDE